LDKKKYEGEFVIMVEENLNGVMDEKGEFKKDKKEGTDLFVCTDRRIYIVFWKNNK